MDPAGFRGVVMVQLRGGLIARWREYQTESSLSWEEFSAATRFEPIDGAR